MTTDRTKVETKGKELLITRVFDALPKLMFDVCSECKHLKHWWDLKD